MYEGATLIQFRESFPIYRVAQLIANENGGRIDESDPLAEPYRKKSESYRKKQREPRRIAYEIPDFMMPWERWEPLLEMLEKGRVGNNPYDHVPLAVLLEVKAALDAGELPSWFYASLGDLSALHAAAGVEA